jgi:ribonuclease HI
VNEALVVTDGSSGKDGCGGWAALVGTSTSTVILSGSSPKTTNNAMEMTAAIEGMQYLVEPHKVYLVSDSAYLLNAIRDKWYDGWFANDGDYTRPNIHLWQVIAHLCEFHEVVPKKVKGHSGDPLNERVDKIAVAARKGQIERTVEIEWESAYDPAA